MSQQDSTAKKLWSTSSMGHTREIDTQTGSMLSAYMGKVNHQVSEHFKPKH